MVEYYREEAFDYYYVGQPKRLEIYQSEVMRTLKTVLYQVILEESDLNSILDISPDGMDTLQMIRHNELPQSSGIRRMVMLIYESNTRQFLFNVKINELRMDSRRF